jgi:transposase
MFSIRAYKLDDRVIVQYYDSGTRDSVVCPECDWRKPAQSVCCDGGLSSGEFSCPQCGVNLGMISSLLPSVSEEPMVFF